MYKTALSPESALMNEFNTFFEMSCPGGRKRREVAFLYPTHDEEKNPPEVSQKGLRAPRFPQVTLSCGTLQLLRL